MTRSITQIESYELISLYDEAVERENETEEEIAEQKKEGREELPFSRQEVRREMLRRLNLKGLKKNQPCRMKLISAQHPKGHENRSIDTLLDVVYQLFHTTPGGTTLDFEVKLQIDTADYATHFPNGTKQEIYPVTAQVEFGEIKTKTVEDALAKLSEWSARAAVALKNYQTKGINLPL